WVLIFSVVFSEPPWPTVAPYVTEARREITRRHWTFRRGRRCPPPWPRASDRYPARQSDRRGRTRTGLARRTRRRTGGRRTLRAETPAWPSSGPRTQWPSRSVLRRCTCRCAAAAPDGG